MGLKNHKSKLSPSVRLFQLNRPLGLQTYFLYLEMYFCLLNNEYFSNSMFFEGRIQRHIFRAFMFCCPGYAGISA